MPPKKTKAKAAAGDARQSDANREYDGLGDDAGGEYGFDGDMDFLRPQQQAKVPADQEKLTEDQKAEVFNRVIAALDPNRANDMVCYNFTKSVFGPDPTSMDHMAVHFEMLPETIHMDSEEYRDQCMMLGIDMEKEKERTSTGAQAGAPEMSPEDKKKADAEEDKPVGKVKVLKNQFNFTERSCQTFNVAMREREMLTEPAPTVELRGVVNQFDMFDVYLDDVNKQIVLKDIKDGKRPEGADVEEEEKKQQVVKLSNNEVMQSTHFKKALKIIERLVGQNEQSDRFTDFKFWEHPADGKSHFLPLWQFKASERTQRKTVTAVCWNKVYTDLVAIGHGIYDFLSANRAENAGGMIACYTLKNYSHPEYTIHTPSGVMCLDFHPTIPSLLVCGLYDGTVCVYDVRSKSDVPLFSSTDPKTKHTDPVWQVGWKVDSALKMEKAAEAEKNAVAVPGQHPEVHQTVLSFYSISSDGRFTNWIAVKNDLVNEEYITLKLITTKESKEDGGPQKEADGKDDLVSLAGGSCFDFNPSLDMLVVGTEEGTIQTYNTEYNPTFDMQFEGHNMAVYAVRWNQFNPAVFLSCSGDWTVKMWEYKSRNAVMTFDLNSSVGDVVWAPYKSTVFACVTAEGWVRVFDIAMNKLEPVGEYRVQADKKVGKDSALKLTHVSFNPTEYVVCVGDEKGVSHCFKLGAQLRMLNGAKNIRQVDPMREMKALDSLLIIQDEQGNNVVTTPVVPKKLVKNKPAPVESEEDKKKKKKEGGEGGEEAPAEE